MQTYTSLVLSVSLLIGLTTNALAVNLSPNQLSDIVTDQQLLSARTRLNGPYQPDRGSGRRNFIDTTPSIDVNAQL